MQTDKFTLCFAFVFQMFWTLIFGTKWEKGMDIG